MVGQGSVGYEFLKPIFSNAEFRTKFKERLDDFIAVGYPQLLEFMDEYATLIEPSVKEDGLLWPDYKGGSYMVTSGYNFRENYANLKTWIKNHLLYMKSHANYGLYE